MFAVFAGLLLHLVDNRRCDDAWVEHRATGFAEAVEEARHSAPTLTQTAAIVDLPPADLARFYDWFATTERTVTLYSQGVTSRRRALTRSMRSSTATLPLDGSAGPGWDRCH